MCLQSLSENEIVQLIKEDLVSSIARDVDRLSEDDLRERVLKLTTELRDRGKWEALRLNESLKRQDEVWANRMEETLRAQVANFEGHLQQIREAEEARALELLKGQHKALLVRVLSRCHGAMCGAVRVAVRGSRLTRRLVGLVAPVQLPSRCQPPGRSHREPPCQGVAGSR